VTYSKEQAAAYAREWRARRRRRAIELLGGVCARCGTTENLEIDHSDRDKDPRLKKSGGALWSFSWEHIEKELAKCQALCTDCHKTKTRTEAARGEQKVQLAKLTEAAVIAIRASSLTDKQLSIRYGVGPSAIWKVRNRKRWKHVK
jgi:5-methylcytosine-specific restriction endonuclease McrA